MKILAPINERNYLPAFVEAGADEFFFGFYEDADQIQFGKYFELNRMSGFARDASRFTISNAIDLAKEIKDIGKDAYITLNSAGYTDEQIRYMEEYVYKLVCAGVDGFIVSCPEAVDLVVRLGGSPVISCVGSAYNKETATFYQKLGVKRIIVPRDLSMKEVESLVRKCPELEFETFIMRNGCILSDGNCLGLHLHKHGGICSSIRKSTKKYFLSNPDELPAVEHMQSQYDTCLYRTACGLCGIYQMVKANITACKVVGRLDMHDKVLEDIRIVRDNIVIAKSVSSENEYFSNMRVSPDCTRKNKNGYSCYFPEIVNPYI